MNYNYSQQANDDMILLANDYPTKIIDENFIRRSHFNSPREDLYDKNEEENVEEMIASKDGLLVRCKNTIKELHIMLNNEKYY